MTRAVDELAGQLLAAWGDEFAAAEPPRNLLVSRGSDAWMWARALAYLFNALDAQAAQNALDILPDKCSDDAVARFGNVYGVPRVAARGARLVVEVTGSPSAVVTIPPGSALVWPADGTLYQCDVTSVTLDGSGVGSVDVTATTAGASTTREVADVLTWSPAVAGLGASAAVSVVTADGADAETFAGWAQRIIDRLRKRTAAGARGEWRAWALAFQGIDTREAWVYPLLQPPTLAQPFGRQETLGCVTLVLAGPPQGDSPVNSRVIGGVAAGRLAAVESFINGRVDALGRPAAGEQLRPVAFANANWTVETINETSPFDVTLALKVGTAAAFSFTFTEPAVDGTSTATSLVLVGDYTSGATDLAGRAVLVNVGTTNYRGGFYRAVLPAGVYSGGLTTFDLTATPLPGAPSAPFYAYPAPGCWAALRAEMFNLFDALGPGDTSPAVRWPTQDERARAVLYLDALRAVALRAQGVLAVDVLAPTDNVGPQRKQVVTLGRLLAVRPT